MNGEKLKLLWDALLSAFPKRIHLEPFLTFELGVRLGDICDEGNFPYQVFEVIQWADKEGRLDELAQKAHLGMPRNPVLTRYVTQYVSQSDPPSGAARSQEKNSSAENLALPPQNLPGQKSLFSEERTDYSHSIYRPWHILRDRYDEMLDQIRMCLPYQEKEQEVKRLLEKNLPPSIMRQIRSAGADPMAEDPVAFIVKVCFHSPSGMEALGDAIYLAFSQHLVAESEIERLEEIIDGGRHMPFSLRQRGSLKMLLARLSANDLTDAYHECRLDLALEMPPIHVERGTHNSILDWLAQLPGVDFPPSPLIRLVHKIREIHPPLQTPLNQWLSQFTAQMPPQEMPNHLPEIETEADYPALWVAIELSRKGRNSKGEIRYNARAWCCSGSFWRILEFDVKRLKSRQPAQNLYKISELKRVFMAVLDTVYANHPTAPTDLPMEVFLPTEDWDLDISDWRLPKRPRDARPLGYRHPLVIRARARLYDKDLLSSCEQKWSLRDLNSSLEVLFHKCRAEDVQDFSSLTNRFNDERCSCVCLSDPVPPYSTGKKHPFNILLHAGIPFALWAGKAHKTTAPTIPQWDELLQPAVPLRDLRAASQNYIRNALPRDESPLVLMWDNPTRLPPQSHLSDQNVRRKAR